MKLITKVLVFAFLISCAPDGASEKKSSLSNFSTRICSAINGCIYKILGMEDYKKLLKKFNKLQYQFNYLKEHSDITRLKPATGETRKIQQELIEFANQFFEDIKELKIKPFLLGGNLIGAIRNNSFIPWDDDLDFGLFRKDYEKLIAYCKNRYVVKYFDSSIKNYTSKIQCSEFKKFILENPGQYILVIRFDMLQLIKGTSLQDIVVIDFFPFDFYKNSYSVEELEKYVVNVRNEIGGMRNFREAVEFIKKARQKNPNIVPFSDNVYFGVDNGDSATVIGKNKGFIPTEVMLPLRKIKFEGFEYWAPNQPKRYLKFRYDDISSWPDDLGYGQHAYYRKYL